MSVRVMLHVLNEETIVADLEGLPGPQDNCVVAHNPRKRDGKRLPMLAEGVNTVIYPWARITFIEVLDESEGVASGDSIVGFFREGGRSG